MLIKLASEICRKAFPLALFIFSSAKESSLVFQLGMYDEQEGILTLKPTSIEVGKSLSAKKDSKKQAQ